MQHQSVSADEPKEMCTQTTSSGAERTEMNEEQSDASPSTVYSDPNSIGTPVKEMSNAETVLEDANRRKPSADSLQMDTSQISSSSTSSEMSIKSIVSCKTQKLTGEEIDPKTGPAVNLDRCYLVGREPADKEQDVGSRQRRPKSSSLLVSEVVRKVDANALKAPVAAVRKTLGQLESGARNSSQSDAQPRSAAPLRRSICWPPPKLGDDDNKTPTQEAPERGDDPHGNVPPPFIGRVTANRLSFQRLIEEQNKNSNSSSTASRPKPAPPVKPAGLVASQLLRSQLNK